MAMRVTDSMLRANALRGLSANASSLAAISEQVATTRRLNRPSDDPAQVRQAVTLHDAIAELEQFTRNIDAGTRILSAADAAMAAAGDTIQRAHELAIQGANGTLSDADRKNMALEVEQLTGQLMQVTSTKVGDSYIFSGFKTDVPPYTSPTGTYQGDAGVMVARISPGTTVQVNVTADAVFGPALAALAQMQSELAAGTPVSGSTIDLLDAGQTALLAGRATVGAVQNRLDSTTDYLGQGIIAAKTLLSQLEDADMTEAFSQLSERQFTYQASLKVNAALLQTSLIDLLR
jgi:flagellar hook-associated protein 3 FlgL